MQAEDIEALAEGHGAVTAHDRPWHLEVLRCRAEARSAALLGDEHLDADHLSAAMRVEETARRWWAAAPAEDRAFMAAYSRGVNQALAGAWESDEEVRTLGLEHRAPRMWEPWTPAAVHIDTHLLTGSLPDQLWRRRVRDALGEAWVRVLDAEAPRSAGSNAWLVPGHLSVSGAPLIAVDPHRIVEESGPYQPVCLSAPGLRVRGMALLGLPGVPHFGRTESAAWAITAAMITTERLREITVTRRGGELIEFASGSAVAETQVKLASSAQRPSRRWLRTFDGLPVLPGDERFEARVADLPEGARMVLTLVCSPHPAEPPRALHACRGLLTATTAEEVVEAFDGWVLPANDLVAADRHGRCLNTVAGIYVDAQGAAATASTKEADTLTVRANQRPEDPVDSSYRLGCAPPHRARRAEHLLSEAAGRQGRITHDDLIAAQLDTRLEAWPGLVARLLTGDSPDGPMDAGTQEMRNQLLSWDGSMDAGSRDAVLFVRWRDTLARQFLHDPALDPLRAASGLPALWAPFVELQPRVGLALESLIEHGAAVGLDPEGAAHRALRELVVQEAVETATRGRSENGAGLPAWGEQHSFRPLRAHPGLTPFPSVAVGGDTDCLLAAGTIPGCGSACLRVPAARLVWDLSDPAASLWITPDPVDRGRLGSSPMQRWARGELDQALPWVPAGGLASTADSGGVIDLGDLAPSTHATLCPVRRAHLPVIHEWVSAARARFWGMNGLSIEQVGAVYELLDSSPTHFAWIVEIDGEPAGIFQTYEPHADPAGAAYRVEPGDLGIHLLLAPASVRSPWLTPVLGAALMRAVAAGGTRRLVAEPDTGNTKAIKRMESMGFVLGREIALPGKTGRLAFRTVDSSGASVQPSRRGG